MVGLHVVLGKGQIGAMLAQSLVSRGHTVRVLSRTGGTSTADIEHVAVDAADAAALTKASSGAEVFYNCANPGGYHLWEREWPPLAEAILASVERHEARLVMLGNLYGYAPPAEPMTEDTALTSQTKKGQLRTWMWHEAMDRHHAGRLRVTEARASDFFGPGAGSNAVMGLAFSSLVRGKTAMALGDPDAPHSWTYTVDVAQALARLGEDERADGHAWHVPTAPACSQREMAAAAGQALRGRDGAVRRMPWWVLTRVVGTAVPSMRGLAELRYQWDRPFIMDSSRFTATFEDRPTDTSQAVKDTALWWRNSAA